MIAEAHGLTQEAEAVVKKIANNVWLRNMYLRTFSFEDLIQEGLIAAWKILPRYDNSTTLTTFLTPRVKGAMIDYIRKCHWFGPGAAKKTSVSKYKGNRMHQLVTFRRSGATLIRCDGIEKVFSEPSMIDRCRMEESEEEFHSLIRSLLPGDSPTNHKIMHLYFYRGLFMREIAQEMGLCESQVWRRIEDCLIKIREKGVESCSVATTVRTA